MAEVGSHQLIRKDVEDPSSLREAVRLSQRPAQAREWTIPAGQFGIWPSHGGTGDLDFDQECRWPITTSTASFTCTPGPRHERQRKQCPFSVLCRNLDIKWALAGLEVNARVYTETYDLARAVPTTAGMTDTMNDQIREGELPPTQCM